MKNKYYLCNVKTTGRFSGKIIKQQQMRIKGCQSLWKLADLAGKTYDETSDIIVKQLICREIIEDDEFYYGKGINEFCQNVSVKEIAAIIESIGLKTVKCDHVKMFMALTLLGDGECPECGGRLIPHTFVREYAGGDGYETPKIYDVIAKSEICENCGRIY